MSAAKPAMPPQTAVTARPRTGSSIFIARSAPATAPKNEAAHARNGVSSQPKMRKNRRTQRMGSGGALPDQGRSDRGDDQPGQESHGKGTQRPPRSRKAEQNSKDCENNRCCERSQQPEPCGWAAIPRRLIGQNPGSHPGQEGTHHPPDRMVPPVTAAPDFQPPVTVGADVLEQDDVEEEEHYGCAEPDPRCAGDSLDGEGPGPEAGEHRDRGEACQQDDGTDDQLDGAAEEPGRQGKEQNQSRLQQPELHGR